MSHKVMVIVDGDTKWTYYDRSPVIPVPGDHLVVEDLPRPIDTRDPLRVVVLHRLIRALNDGMDMVVELHCAVTR